MTQPQNTPISTNRKRKSLLVLTILILIATLIFGGYLGYDLILNKINYTFTKNEETSTAVKQLQAKYDLLQNNVQNLQNEVQKSKIIKAKYWKPMVVEHLVHMADLTLNTTGNINLALSFMLTARQYSNDPELSAIDHALNKDIANLQVVPTIDTADLVLKVESISQKMASLPIVPRTLVDTQKPMPAKEAPSVIKTLWQRFFTSTINALKDIIIIRHQNVSPLPSPEQETIVRLEIQAKLLQAQLAIMQRQNKLYQSCLAQTANLITHYFVANQYVTTEILPLLQELQHQDLQPKIPSPTESITAITNFINANKIPEEKPQPVYIAPQKEPQGVQLL